MFSQLSFAQISGVNPGSSIEASKLNEVINTVNALKTNVGNYQVYDVGDVRSSLLTESSFQTRNGNCWVLMNGQSVAGSLYASVTGRPTLPSAEGRFLRNAGGNAAVLATTQEDEFESHTHTQAAHNHIQNAHNHSVPHGTAITGGIYVAGGNNIFNGTSGTTSSVTPTNNAATAVNQNSGGVETRPQNLTVNIFIKINDCN